MRHAPFLLASVAVVLCGAPLACDPVSPSEPPASGDLKLMVADLDRSGFSDLVTFETLDSETTIEIRLGHRGGELSTDPDVTDRLAFEARAVQLADTDGDGCVDLLAVDTQGHLHRRAGTCEPGSLPRFEPDKRIELAGEFGALEGAVDMAVLTTEGEFSGLVGTSGSNELWCLAFDEQAAVRVQTRRLPKADALIGVSAADLDGDQRSDVAALAAGGRAVHLLRGRDSVCGFGARRDVPVDDASSIALADLDWDGQVDLMVRSTRGKLAWRAGTNSESRFGEAQSIDLGRFNSALAAAPIDVRTDRKVSLAFIGYDADGSIRLGVEDLQPQPLVIRPGVTPLDPTQSCPNDRNDAPEIQDAIQQALAAPGPGIVQLEAGTYCLRDPLWMRSGVTLRGAGSKATVLSQRGSGESGILARWVRAATVEDLGLLFVPDTGFTYGEFDNTCEKVPNWPDDRCLWKRAVGVSVHGTLGFTVRRVHIRNPTQGVLLSDVRTVAEPTRGPFGSWEYAPSASEPEFLYVTRQVCSRGLANVGALIEDVDVAARGPGVELKNSVKGTIRRNVLHDAGKAFGLTPASNASMAGLKATCGPVQSNLIYENYSYGNLEDGMDIAWRWASDAGFGDPEEVFVDDTAYLVRLRTLTYPIDGMFRGNLLAANLFFRNSTAGVEFKSSEVGAGSATPEFGCATQCGVTSPEACEGLVEPYNPGDPDTLLRIGQNTWFRNVLLDNWQIAPPSGVPGDLTLTNVFSPAGCVPQPEQRRRGSFVENVVWRASADLPGGSVRVLFNDDVRNVAFLRNWFGTADDADVLLLTDLGDLTPGDPDLPYEDNVETSDPQADAASREAILLEVFTNEALTGMACDDADNDGCANGCEALLGSNPSDVQDAAADCPSCMTDYACGP